MPQRSHRFYPGNPDLFRERLLSWYGRNRRDLPWRRTRDPYRVWLSEIMLQQTRVAAVLEHYRRFLQRFPTIESLAAARESSVLAAWSGLGYYRRARMMHAAAKLVMRDGDGKIPETSAALRRLSGIGRYTAAAIASIAFGEPVAVVDGNVERVLERLSGTDLSGQALWDSAQYLLSHDRPGDFNQAMMELGATTCLPAQPLCATCPIREFCLTRGRWQTRTKSTRQRKREIHYALGYQQGCVFLVKRPSNASLMPGMWELPTLLNRRRRTDFRVRHSITVTNYTVHVSRIDAPAHLPGKWVPRSRLLRLPLTGLARKVLRAAGVLHSASTRRRRSSKPAGG
ncbi:MAG TPA: A/G-specific adenine glycosylase [Terriglobales bacterium]